MSRRASSVMQPMAIPSGIDYESSDEEDNAPPRRAPAPAPAPSNPNHRPMVGGFAAAAYEAARAHHLALQQKKKQQSKK